MKASFVNDTAKGGGHGFVHISEATAIADLEGIRFAIKRASDQKTLGGSDWQQAESFLDPQGISLTDNGFALAVGPAVVDKLDATEIYRITLQGADGSSERGVLTVDEVAYSPVGGGQGIGAMEAPKPPVYTPPPLEQPAPPLPEDELPPPPPPLSEEGLAPPPPSFQEEAFTPPPPPPLPQEDFASPSSLSMPEPKSGGSKMLPIILILVVLGLAGSGFLVWKYVLQKPSGDGQTSSTTQEDGAKTSLSRARELLAASASPEQALELAKDLRKSNSGADAAFLLAEDAGQKGNGEAMLMTGSFYDPVNKEAHGSIIKDPEQALSWYQKAKSAGSQDAQPRLDALRAWAEKEASSGNPLAKKLLLKL